MAELLFSFSEIQFVNPIPSELEIHCGICLGLLIDPQLTQCCGHHFCHACLNRIVRDKRSCPLCNTPQVKAMLNKGLQRTINGMEIYCSNKSHGCSWQGEVRGLGDHLQRGEREGECQYTKVECTNKCGNKIERHLLKNHENEWCSNRPIFDPVDITRRMDGVVKENEKLKATIDRLSKLNSINTQNIAQLTQQLKTANTEITLLKQNLLSVAEGDVDISNLSKSLEIKSPSAPVISILPTVPIAVPVNLATPITNPSMDAHLRIAPYEFTFNNFARRCENPEMWFCRPFYSHAGGYKICLRVAPQGLGNGEGTHVSVHTYLMKGEYDDMLTWPFRGAVTVQLLNQIGSECHHEQTSDFNNRTPPQYSSRLDIIFFLSLSPILHPSIL